MDTKLKNFRYSLGAKAAAVILAWLCFLGAIGSGIFLLSNESIASSKDYFETDKFTARFEALVRNTVELNIQLKNDERIKAFLAGEDVVADKLHRFYNIQSSLYNTVNFAYYIKNSGTGEILTNVTAEDPAAFIEKQPAHMYFSQWKSRYDDAAYTDEIRQMLLDTAYEVYAGITVPLKPGDVFYNEFMDYSKIKPMTTYALIALILCICLFLLAAIYLVYVAGRREKGGEIVHSHVDRIYTDVHTVLLLIAAYLSVLIVANTFHPSDMVAWIAFFIVLSADVFIGMSYVLSMVRQIKSGRIFENTLILAVWKGSKAFARLCFSGKMFRASLLLLLLAYGVVDGVLLAGAIYYNNDDVILFIFMFLLAAFNIAAVYFSAKALLSLSQIMGAVKEISGGNLDYAMNGPEISAAFSGFAEDIKSIQGGLKKAVAEAVKGERMKTDLITNVSHDLKTPLTSIISYVDLLKKEELSNEKAYGYVDVLEEKSARLKQLIEDLIEASKASSGSLSVNAERFDLHELVLQACGEYEEKIGKAGLELRINADEKKTFVYADGKHMWRIIENLLSNAVKYSMPNSRIYVEIARGDKDAVLTMKNMSAFPLNIPPEQLTERFVRGDAARTTEGSGLGLSIAQSLASLQGGRFKIEIDGDLFKAVVAIPLWTEMQA